MVFLLLIAFLIVVKFSDSFDMDLKSTASLSIVAWSVCVVCIDIFNLVSLMGFATSLRTLYNAQSDVIKDSFLATEFVTKYIGNW